MRTMEAAPPGPSSVIAPGAVAPPPPSEAGATGAPVAPASEGGGGATAPGAITEEGPGGAASMVRMVPSTVTQVGYPGRILHRFHGPGVHLAVTCPHNSCTRGRVQVRKATPAAGHHR